MNDRTYNQGADKLRSTERVKRLEVERVVELCLQGTAINSILDIGTGSGLFAEAFSKFGISVTGIDLNEEILETAKEYLPNNDFKIGSAENIPFDDGTFDAAFFGLVFHEVDDYKKAMLEAYRVARLHTFILEWQYKVEDFGPPIEHRLESKFIKDLALTAGYKSFTTIPLSNLILYKFNK